MLGINNALRAIVILTFVLLCAQADSQVLNIESRRFREDTLGWVGLARFKFNLTKNTTTITELGTTVQLQYRTPKTRFLILNDINFIKAGENTPINTGYTHLRMGRKLNTYTTLEAFTQGQYNKPLRMDVRWASGLGPRFRVVKTDKARIYLASLVMYEYEENRVDQVIHRDVRSSSYLSFHLVWSSLVEWENTLYFQPNVMKISDYRIAGESSVTFHVSKRLAYSASYNYLLDTKQPRGVPEWTYRFENRLEFKF